METNDFQIKNVTLTSLKSILMKAKLLILFLLMAPAAWAQVPVLVTPQWLSEHKGDPNLVILQVNFLEAEYNREHIAGARFLWPGWLAPNSPQASYNAPDLKEAQRLLQNLGISNTSHVVVCHVKNEVAPSARMFLTLEYLGLRGQVSFLNGGLEAWKKEGLPVTTEKPAVPKGKFKVAPNALLVDKEYVLKTLQSTNVVVDARIPRFYDGDPTGNPRDGHIAGAKNIPYTEMVDELNRFKSMEELQTYFAPVVPDKKNEVVTYCFIGQTASVVYLAGRVLGYDMKLYDGSMQEWSWLENLPMETTKK
jgi:thiosulfate/3-mercaptopyruvate sulfurtransferase